MNRLGWTAFSAASVMIIAVSQLSSSQEPLVKSGTSEPLTVAKDHGYKPRAFDSDAKQGKKYFEQQRCSTCHSIQNAGGSGGPVFDGIGQRRSPHFLENRLTDTTEAKNEYARLTNLTPEADSWHPHVSSAIAHQITAYLLTLPEPPGGFAIVGHKVATIEPPAPFPDLNWQPEPRTQASDEGAKLYQKLSCAQCHQIAHAGGELGPALDGIGGVFGRDYIRAHVTNARVHAIQNNELNALVPTPMPVFPATPTQVERIVDYLMTIPSL